MSRIFPTNRRAFLGGASVCVALPFLEALTPKKALGQAGAAQKRFASFFIPNGMVMEDGWMPTGTGTDFQLGPTMGPQRVFNDGLPPYPADEDGPGLEGFKDQLLIISGLSNTEKEVGPGDHAGGIGSMLTNRTVMKQAGLGMGGPSIDFVIAQKVGMDTRFPNLVMGARPGRNPGGTCDSYPCSVGGYITFDADGQNLPHVGAATQVFDSLFQGFDPNLGQEALAAARALDRSILDTVHAQGTALLPSLALQDHARLDKYLTSVRDTERRLSFQTGTCSVPEQLGPDVTNKESMDTFAQLIALAFQCDQTRVASFMWGIAADGRDYTSIGMEKGHHGTSHHNDRPEKLAQLRRAEYWYYRRLAWLAQLLQEMDDVDGKTVLDNTLIFQSSDVSNASQHSHEDMPVVLLGGGGGLQMGRHLAFAGQDRWFGHLFTSLGQAFGADVTKFGERGDGPLTGLFA